MYLLIYIMSYYLSILHGNLKKYRRQFDEKMALAKFPSYYDVEEARKITAFFYNISLTQFNEILKLAEIISIYDAISLLNNNKNVANIMLDLSKSNINIEANESFIMDFIGLYHINNFDYVDIIYCLENKQLKKPQNSLAQNLLEVIEEYYESIEKDQEEQIE